MNIVGRPTHPAAAIAPFAFVAKNHVGRALLLLIAAVAVFGLGYYLAGRPRHLSELNPDGKSLVELAGYILMFPTALLALAWLRLIVDRRPQIIIDARGILVTGWSNEIVPWSEVRAVRERNEHGLRSLAIDLHNPDRFAPSGSQGLQRAFLRARGYGDLWLNPNVTNRSFAELRDALTRFSGGRLAVEGASLS